MYIYQIVISPNGDIYNIEHLTKFCQSHNLSISNMSMLLRGKKHSYKGWKIIPSGDSR
jgi:hypothetical protein